MDDAPAVAREESVGPGLLIHIHGPATVDIEGARRVARNARTDLRDVVVEVVVQGLAVTALTDTETLSGLSGRGDSRDVSILACANSLASAGLRPDDLAMGVGVVPAAVGHLARRQWQGWAYVRL